MKIIYSSSSKISINLGDDFGNIVITASGERLENGFNIYSDTLRQIEPVERELSISDQQKIIEAVSEWNSNFNTLVFD
jgi:hypothetical protein